MAPHRLDPLLRPHSCAVVGASRREGSPGNEALVNLRAGSFPGEYFAVNPRYESIGSLRCYASLAELPRVPQHVIFVVSDELIETLFDEAVSLGVEAFSIFSSLQLVEDSSPGLRERIRHKAQSANVLLHGANCMGFFNFRDGLHASAFDTRVHRGPGNVALLCQSGAGMSGILDCEQRLDFNFAASTGQELCLSMEDYLDFVLDLPETRVVGLFLETSRHPEKFVLALQKAQRLRIPVVALKVGKTELSARMAVSHSGALAGSDSSYQALFERYGVQRVDDMAQLATTLIMFSRSPLPGQGALVCLHDSGGERQLAIDMAEELTVPLTVLRDDTVTDLASLLDPGLPAVNPLDAWGAGGAAAGETMQACFSLLINDPGAAIGVVVHDRAPEGAVYASYIEYLRAARLVSNKPVFLVANHQGTGHDPHVVDATRDGLPVLDGLREFLIGARALLRYRDFLDYRKDVPPGLNPDKLQHWRKRLQQSRIPGEAMAAELLSDLGIPVLRGSVFSSRQTLADVAGKLNYPVVLKTANPEIAHKTECNGVFLDIPDKAALLSAYDDMESRLGGGALVLPMVQCPGIEMMLGVTRDEQFGPTIVIAIGGIHAELLRDVTVLLPPFGPEVARRALSKLKLRPLLDGVRGSPPLDVTAFCEMAARLSVLAVTFSDIVEEIDINPVKVMTEGCIGLDALVVTLPEEAPEIVQ